MTEEEDSDKMQKIHETSLGCLKSKESQYNPLERGNVAEGPLKVKDEINVHQGDIAGSNESFNRDVTTSLNQVYSRPFYQQEVFTWPNIPMDIQMLQQNHLNPFKNQFYPRNRDCSFPVENGIPYMPFKMLPQAHLRDIQYQDFQYFVVIDFEATCDKEKNPHPQEIIEFPSVLVNSMTGQLEACFKTYVRPVYHQLLTDFCKELTGIQQIQVDRGVSLNDALLMHDKWLEDKGIKHKNFAVVTWSNWDCNVMLESECRFKSIRKPHYFNRWINLRVPFQEVFGGRPLCSLKEAVQLAGLAWEGRPHCGLDDARNTARLLAVLMHLGYKFSITNSLVRQSAEALMEPFQQPQKPKDLVVAAAQFHNQLVDPFSKDHRTYCHCGVLSSKCVVRKPGPTQGRCFFGCGNWTAARRSVCNYFMWASP